MRVMSRKELESFDTDLNNNQSETGQLLSKKRGYYFYYNIPNRETKPLKIHKHTCGECCFGIGKQPNALPGRNGTWIGPCHSIDAMITIIQDIIGETPTTCTCCK